MLWPAAARVGTQNPSGDCSLVAGHAAADSCFEALKKENAVVAVVVEAAAVVAVAGVGAPDFESLATRGQW